MLLFLLLKCIWSKDLTKMGCYCILHFIKYRKQKDKERQREYGNLCIVDFCTGKNGVVIFMHQLPLSLEEASSESGR
jgi:hypothetical protein